MRFVIIAFVLMLLAGFLHITFIMFDSLWYDEESGIIPKIADSFNRTLSSDGKNDSWNATVMLRDAFGLGRVICLALVPICLIIEAVDKPRIQG